MWIQICYKRHICSLFVDSVFEFIAIKYLIILLNTAIIPAVKYTLMMVCYLLLNNAVIYLFIYYCLIPRTQDRDSNDIITCN